ncbi:hypothetical protein Lepto7375DRAFT_0060 [Leptolyngbya sp. PCC 7375]|nr:hypothetical protein Lepto7375DRAFT_0060 [Leptolyngbya sp. PCC 7375]
MSQKKHSQDLIKKAHQLRAAGYMTPDICCELDLPGDVVIELLMSRVSTDAPVGTTYPREQWTMRERSKLSHLLASPATEFGFQPSNVWTAPRVIALAKQVMGKRLSKDTLRRRLQASGITFTGQLNRLGCARLPECAFELHLRHPRHQVYGITWIRSSDVGIENVDYTTALVGVTISNRIAFSIWPKVRLSPQGRRHFPLKFLRELLALHKEAHVIAITPVGMFGAQTIEQLQHHHHRLHVVVADERA